MLLKNPIIVSIPKIVIDKIAAKIIKLITIVFTLYPSSSLNSLTTLLNINSKKKRKSIAQKGDKTTFSILKDFETSCVNTNPINTIENIVKID